MRREAAERRLHDPQGMRCATFSAREPVLIILRLSKLPHQALLPLHVCTVAIRASPNPMLGPRHVIHWYFYVHNLKPLPPPDIHQILTMMLRTGMLSQEWVSKSVDLKGLNDLWKIACNPTDPVVTNPGTVWSRAVGKVPREAAVTNCEYFLHTVAKRLAFMRF